jgi:hypothetical protein
MAQPDPPQTPNALPAGTPGGVNVTWEHPASGQPDSYEVLALPTMTVHPARGDATSLPVDGLEVGATYTFEIRSITADGKSEPAQTPSVPIPEAVPSRHWRTTSCLLVGLLLLAGVVALLLHWSAATRHGLAFACGVVGLALGVLTLIGWPDYGLWRGVIGADRRVSTSYLTTGLWTVLVAFFLAYLTGQTWFDDKSGLFAGFLPSEPLANGMTPAQENTAPVWDDYLVLLGGPFAALVFARGIVASKVQGQTVQKTVADDGTANLRQALTDDGGNIDLVDSQYLLFNIVALAYVIVAFATHNRLPQIPAVLLALTGSSAATYVVNKAVSNSAPTVTGVVPSSFRPGERIVITGTNLVPAGRTRPPTVTIGGKQALVDANATNARVTAIVPPGVPAGTQELLVTTAARATSDARTVEVLADEPRILAIDPPTPTIGQPVTIRGSGFTSALDETTTCSVLIGDALALTTVPTRLASGLDEITVTVPAGVTLPDPANVVVRTPRLTSSPAMPVKFTAG